MIIGRRLLKPLALLAVVLATQATSCNGQSTPFAVLKYTQTGACNGFVDGSGGHFSGPNAAYVVWRISIIDNTASGAKDLNFDPAKLFVNDNPRAFVSPTLQLSQTNPFIAQGRLVKAGTTETFNGSVVAVLKTGAADGAAEASKTSYNLLYDTPAGTPGILPSRQDPNRTSWPFTPKCTDIVF